MESWKKLSYQIIISELEQMSRYLDLMNSAIQDNQKKLEEDMKEITKNMNEEERTDFYDFYENELIEAGGNFPILLFSSFVTNWYSFIEVQLISLCNILDLKISISIKDKTSPDKGIKLASNFLDKAANYKIDNGQWQELENIRNIRNKLVHEGGIIIPKPTKVKSVPIDLGEDGYIYLPVDDKLYAYLNKHNLYRVGQHKLTPDYTYCKHLVKLGAELLTKIYTDFNLST
ncbi:hypothetical protein [Nostoc sp.]|uniref:hypothetical protein n=1 Tax=Nostoc sp. TaxID=1180 RepID=UPI002FF88BB6